MTDRKPTRRRVLQISGAALATGIAGCSSSESSPSDTTTPKGNETTETGTRTATPGSEDDVLGPTNDDDLPSDPKPHDGYPPEFDEVPPKRNIDTNSFETLVRDGPNGGNVEVALVPVDIAYYWYARGEARFVDTRSRTEFETSHIFGSVLSPAPDGQDMADPTRQWPKNDRIITYCDCPHHLSTLRASRLIENGYDKVYAIDEGYSAWRDRNYPLAGENTDSAPTTRTISGSAGTRNAGETAWAYDQNSDQKEATTINADGSYELHLKFVDMTGDMRIRVKTPAYEVTGTLDELTSGYITAEGTVESGPSGTGGSGGNETNSTNSTDSTNTTNSTNSTDDSNSTFSFGRFW